MRTVAKKVASVIISAALILGTFSAIPGKITASAASNVANAVVNAALGQVGYREGKNNYTKYGTWFGYQVAWCCTFVTWSVNQAGIATGTKLLGSIAPRTASCAESQSYYKSRGRYYTRSSGYSPSPGDFIYFNWQSPSGRPQHIGIVVSVSGGKVYTVEGNSSDSVRKKSYSLSSSKILGYAHPNYPGGSSAVVVKEETTTKAKKTTTEAETTTKAKKTTKAPTTIVETTLAPTTTKKTTTTTTATPETTTAAQQEPSSTAQLTLNTNKVEVPVGKTVSLKANLKNARTNESVLTWSSDNAEVATVSENGVVKGLSNGQATIMVKSAGGETAKCTVTVKDATESIYLNYENSTIVADTSIQLKATTDPADTGETIEWTSNNEAVATVSENGLVTGVTPGEATITAKTSNGQSVSCHITVEAPTILVQDIDIDTDFKEIQLGETFKLNAILTPLNATEGITWTSSNESILTVSETGEVTAVGGGSATVTATAEGGLSATCIITVKVPTSNVRFENPNVTLERGQIYKADPVLSDSNTTDILIWYSSNTNIAIISPDGEVTAINPGTTTIRVETSGGITAEYIVTVK